MIASRLTPAELVKDALSGYGQVFFTANRLTSALFMTATFLNPAQGLAGLAGLSTANAMATLLGMPVEKIRQGYYGCNGLLMGLALGYVYRLNPGFAVMLVCASFVGVLLANSLATLFERYLGTPALSVPFVLTTWIALTAGGRFSSLAYNPVTYEPTSVIGTLPHTVEFIAKSLGATFFQPGATAGLLVMAGLLVFSRHAFILGVSGLAAGSGLHLVLGGPPDLLEGGWIGFNYALTAIALGGIWTAPSPASFALAMIGAAVCSVLACAASSVLAPLGVPLLAFPFVTATTLVLFSLKTCQRAGFIDYIDSPCHSPEENFKRSNTLGRRRLNTDRPAVELPFHGAWIVTQGPDGEHTHRFEWRHAWDFEVLASENSLYRDLGNRLTDYPAFGAPALAPADGRVVRVVDNTPDNEIGQMDTQANWGNCVIIRHYGDVCTALCHLARDEVSVAEGAQVRAGQAIAKVGSSGRSPRPHLHMHVQQGPEIGAATLESEILHYVVEQDGRLRYVTRGTPQKDDAVMSLIPDASRFQAASSFLGQTARFVVRSGSCETEEIWNSKVDFWGARYLTCEETGARLKIYLDKKSLILLDYQGPRQNGLWWLFLALPRLPLTKMDVIWSDSLPPSLLLSPATKPLWELIEPFVPIASISAHSRFLPSRAGGFSVETVAQLEGPLFKGRPDILLVSKFDYRHGLVSIAASKEGRQVAEIVNVSFADNETRYDRSVHRRSVDPTAARRAADHIVTGTAPAAKQTANRPSTMYIPVGEHKSCRKGW